MKKIFRTIRVSAQTRKHLNAYKKKCRFHNMDDVIMSLLQQDKKGGK